ncbi:MAG: SUMF1/EgtB/PvdO family nonheme iron enzyme [Bacteroidales bacterium]|nr:SUMF1/EgtB/PvdO family nonheme iron enzyme [Bacteroidales bacterium]
MKKYFFICHLILSQICIQANNVSVGTPVLVSPSPIEQTVYVEFDLSWENSWRNATNYDAVWVFVKYKDSSGQWQHAYLNNDNNTHTVQNDNGVNPLCTVGINNISGQNRGIGLFLYRQSNGVGPIDWDDVRIKWNYGENGVPNHEVVEVQVFAIEMVYVPEGSFSVGDGASFSRFHKGDNVNASYTINNTPIQFNTSSGGLWAIGAWDAPTGTLSTIYPTGYNAFYTMKYSITQDQYVAFLNTLTRTQQQERTASNIASGINTVSAVYLMSQSLSPQFRNGIRCDGIIPVSDPVEFYCDLNNNGVMNESTDGQHIACNYLSWGDGTAYAAWSGLRPLTETEYEKACRGTSAPVSGECAWGNATINGATSISNAGSPNEITNTGANCVYNNASGVQGPVRVGAFATPTSNRQASGASFYGIMELSGNLWERVISLGSAAGRNFTGNHGNGDLNTQGNAAINNWPGNNGVGSGFRGGHWNGTVYNAKVSGRDNASYESSVRNEMFGFRLVRSE